MASSSSTESDGVPEVTLTVKTLDGKNSTFTAPENFTIKQFKEKISGSIEIPADTQRLIFQGRVMQDEKLLKDYDVNGKVIHLVQRAPPTSLSGASSTSTTSATSTTPPQPTRRSESHVFHLGRVQQHPTSREARARLRQAEFNLGIINDALHLLERRTGVTQENLPGPDEAELRCEDNMDSSTPSSASAPTSSETAMGDSDPPTSSSQEQEQQQPQQTASGTGPSSGASNSQDNSLTATELADFLDRVLRTNNRMVPHLRRYRNFLRSEENYSQTSRDRRSAQETVNRVNEALHAMGHMMHSLSDVMVNMGTQHPRQAVAHPPNPFPLPGTASMSIPLHMNIRARANGNGNQQSQQQQTNQRQTGNAPPSYATAAATDPSVSAGSNTPGPAPAGPATSNGGGSRTTFGPFQIPLGTIPFPGVTTNGSTANVIVEALPPQISVHNIGVIQTEDDLYGSSGESNDSNASMESTVTVEASSVPEGRPQAPATSSSGNQQTTTATTVSGHFGSVPGSTSTSSFTFGPTTSVNVLPNVPGMPPGVLQNIIGTLLQQQGRGNQPVQVNVIRQTSGQSVPQQVVMDLPLDGHMEHHSQAHFDALRGNHFPPGERPPGSSTDASQQAAPSTVDASTATRSNAATSTRGTEAATNTSTASTVNSATAATNTDRDRHGRSTTATATANVGVGDGTFSNSSVGTGTDPGLGMNTQATNTPQMHAGRGRGISISVRPPQLHGQPPRHHHHHHHHQQPHLHPAPPGTGAMMNSVYADPFLFCHSHNYDTQSARTAYRALQTRMRARGQQMPQPNQQVPNLSTMVSGLVGNIFGQAGQAFNIGSRPGASTTASNTTASTGTATTTSSSAPSQGSTSTTNTSTSGAQPPPINPMEMFASLFGAPGARPPSAGQMPIDLGSVIGNLMQATRAPPPSASGSGTADTSGMTPPSNPPGGTLADMFTFFRPQGEEQEESASVLVSLLETVAPHMGLADLFSLVMGNSRVVGQLRGPLRQFVSERLENAGGSMDTLVSSALDDMMVEIQHIQSLVQVRSGVDMALSVRNCLQAHLTTLFTAINSDSPSDLEEFGRNLYSLWMNMMAETIGLCVYCIQDGQTGFSNMVQRYMPRMNQGMNPAITMWMTTSLQDILGSFHRNHPVAESQIMRYVVRTDSPRLVTTPSTAEATPATPATPGNNTRSSTREPAVPASSAPTPMEVGTESPSPQPPKAKAARTAPDEEDSSGEIFVDAQETLTSRAPPPPQTAAQPATTRVRPNSIATSSPAAAMGAQRPPGARNGHGSSDNWQSVIPQEWIPVISQDVARQRDQRPQTPLSDAYIQGLPAKRRRMMTVEHVNEMGSMGRYLPSALTRAARAARVEPISSEENLVQEAAENLDLQADLEQEVTAVLGSRVTSDSDFSSERFPNAKEYFHKSKRH